MIQKMLLAVYVAIASASCTAWRPTATRDGVRVDRDVVYSPADWPAPLRADLYRPDSDVPTPAVLLIHGGGWHKQDRRGDMVRIARELSKRNYFVMNATYRLTPDWRFPAQIEDIELALKTLRQNASLWNIDPNRIATFGYSAGGHLAALAGLQPENQVKAIIAGGAPTDLALWPDGKLTGLLIGGPVAGNETRYREASPVTYVQSASPPVFIYHGDADTLVSLEHPHALMAALKKHDVDHEVYWIEGRSHVFAHLFPGGAITAAIDFLDQALGPVRKIN